MTMARSRSSFKVRNMFLNRIELTGLEHTTRRLQANKRKRDDIEESVTESETTEGGSKVSSEHEKL